MKTSESALYAPLSGCVRFACTCIPPKCYRYEFVHSLGASVCVYLDVSVVAADVCTICHTIVV